LKLCDTDLFGEWRVINIKNSGYNADNTLYIEMHEDDIYDNPNACINSA